MNISKKSYRIFVCGDTGIELHLSFYCKFHYTERAKPCNKVCNVLTDNELPEHFDRLSNVELVRLFLFGLPDDGPPHISVAVFCPVDDFFKSCDRF